MDKIKQYENYILNLLNHYATFKPANAPKLERLVIADKETHHYQLLSMGWDGPGFVHSCLMHLSIRNGKIWLMQNWTDWLIASELVKLGVPKMDIVLGFYAPEVREDTEYAVE